MFTVAAASDFQRIRLLLKDGSFKQKKNPILRNTTNYFIREALISQSVFCERLSLAPLVPPSHKVRMFELYRPLVSSSVWFCHKLRPVLDVLVVQVMKRGQS